jgi:diadenosine tetraphosphate (Ap4A) HIT family hydrolase
MSIHDEIRNSEHLFYKDEDILICLDHDPISKGHVLILPQGSYLDLDEMPIDLVDKIFRAGQLYMKLAKEKFDCQSFSMMQNGGIFNDINVYHLHIIPRYKVGEFGFKRNLDKEKTKIELLAKSFQEQLGH